MRIYTKNEILRVIRSYNADHDTGPDAPVTWREERLATAILEMHQDIEELEAKISAILDAVPSAKVQS